jgi:hypothetical protein
MDERKESSMFILDDILLSPLKGLAAVCRKVEDAARQDLADREKDALASLTELHRRLETNQIDDREFETQEARLLEQIEELQGILHPQEEAETIL